MPQQVEVPGMGVVEFPDGMNDEQIAAAIKTNTNNPASTGAKAADVVKSLGIGAVKGATALVGLPGDIRSLVGTGVLWAGGKLGLPAPPEDQQRRLPDFWPPTSSAIQNALESITGKFYKPQTTAGEYANTVGEFVPGLIGGGGIGALARRAVTQVATPAVASEAAGQYTRDTAAEPYARIVGAIAGGMAPGALGRLVTPLPAAPARQRLVDVLADEGVNSITAGQRTGRPALRYAESTLGDYPGAGAAATNIQQEGQRQFTVATLRRAGTGTEATPEVLAANNARLGNEFQQLSARNTLAFDQGFVNDATRAIRNYERVPPLQQRAIVENYIDDIVGHMQAGGMPGAYYQEMRSRLSRQANSLRNTDPTLSEALRDIRNALDNGMRRSISPADREAWDTARRQWGAQKVIEKSAARAGEVTAEGQIMPANLRNTIAAENRGAYARGEGQFSELARAGSGIMGQMPQSGTGPRTAITALTSALGGGGVVGALSGLGPEAAAALAAGATAPAVMGRALMSRPMQAYLSNQTIAPLLNSLPPPQRTALINALLASGHGGTQQISNR